MSDKTSTQKWRAWIRSRAQKNIQARLESNATWRAYLLRATSIGTHAATWESADGSKVTGTQQAVAPGGSGNISLQLVKANPASGPGAMQGVSYIQRVATAGGVAPAAPCGEASVGQKQVVPYRADYIFWRAA